MDALKIDLCYLVSHGFASRMLMQTDLLGRLRRNGLRIAVIAPDRNDPVLGAYCRANDIVLEEFEAKKGFFSDDYLFKRRYYLEDVRANPALWEKHMAATRFHPARNPLKRLRPYWYSLMNRLVPRFPGIRERFKRRESRYLHSPEAKALLDRLQPSRLVATYPVSLSEAILLHYGNRDPGIDTWIHLLSWDNITCKGRFAETADSYIAWGPVMRDELKAHYGVPDARIHMCGVPHFDLHQDPRVSELRPEVLAALGLEASRPYLLFAMSSPRFAPNEIDVVEWLAARVATGEFGDMQLLVRPHPQNVSGNMADPSWLPRLEALGLCKGIAIAYPKLVRSRLRWSMQDVDMHELAAMLSGAAVVLNSGSTVSIDALAHDRSVVITSFDGEAVRDYWDSARRLVDYSHLKTLVGLGGVRVTHNYNELAAVIRDELANPGQGAEARASAYHGECLSRDGEATSRVVAVLGQAVAQAPTPAGLS